MPFTKRQIARILEPDLIDAQRVPHLGMRLTETYLRRKLYAWEDRAVTQQWHLFDRAARAVQAFALRAAVALGIDHLQRSLAVVQWQQRVQAYADQQIQTATQQTALDAFRASLTAWYAGYYGKAWQLDMVTRPEIDVRVPRPNQQRAHQALLLPDLREAVEPNLNTYAGLGVEWRQRYENERDEMRVKVRRALDRAVVEEMSVTASMRSMREAIGLADTPREGFRQNFYRMQTLTRTSIMDGAQDGGEALWQANAAPTPGDHRGRDSVVMVALSQMIWLTARDERVCPICRALDGQMSTLFNPFRQRPPAHGSCRCWEIPLIEEILMTAADDWPTATWGDWLVGAGAGLILNDFLDAGLESTQI